MSWQCYGSGLAIALLCALPLTAVPFPDDMGELDRLIDDAPPGDGAPMLLLCAVAAAVLVNPRGLKGGESVDRVVLDVLAGRTTDDPFAIMVEVRDKR